MGFKFIVDHFNSHSDARNIIQKELEEVERGNDSRTQLLLRREGIEYLSVSFPPVNCIDDLDTLPQRLTNGKEFAFSQLFDPKLVDACIVRGIFPLTINIGGDNFLFSPKLHQVRLVCATAKAFLIRNGIKYFPLCDDNKGVFQVEKLNISKKFLKPTNDVSRSPCFDIFVNRKEDLVDVFSLIRQQHGENWLCKALRKCFFYILFHEENFESKIVVIAVRRHKYQNDSRPSPVSSSNEVKEGDLVAAEIGYIVGDIYTSATGAYCVSGAGKLQLAVTGCILHDLGCKVWDLGMLLDYKNSLLGCVEIKREEWIQMMKHRRQYSIFDGKKTNEFLLELQKGKNVGDILRDSAKH